MILTSPPVVSVVIPTFNRQNLMLRAVRSVLNQSFSNYEIIVVVDGSKDGTPEALQAIGDDRIRVLVHRENRGAPAARNTGIKAATGAYIAFLDDDDIWFPEKLEMQLTQMGACDALLCGYRVMGERRDRSYRLRDVGLKELKKTNPFGGSGLLVKTFIAKGLQFNETLPKAQDWDFLIRLALQWRIGYITEVLYLVDAGNHRRITNGAKSQSIATLKRRSTASWKHCATIGSYWLRYRIAADQLGYIRSQHRPLARFLEVGRYCGWLPSCHVLADRAWIHLRYR